ncbi:8194_t:CDS:2 [Cetraspora pellucida]|uniref:8194_t:CDS:1 n=1 Tax=Cetraspora pellucida TaxID=1433469 RepID=A0A9N8ZNQ9_9GLOM|nr:8194_t:CDS:2 [Cetraspora pellucida]
MLSSESKTQNTFSSTTGTRNIILNLEISQYQNRKGCYPGTVSAAFYLARFVENDMSTILDFILTSQDVTIDSKKLSRIPKSSDKSEEKLLSPLNYEKFKMGIQLRMLNLIHQEHRKEIVEEILHLQDWLDQDIILIIKEFYIKLKEYLFKWKNYSSFSSSAEISVENE